MNILVTICTRKGSKGLPGKSMIDFCGKPLSQWTIEQAVDWGRGDVVVSSDDLGVLCLAKDMGVNYFARAKPLCQDDTPKLDVLRDGVGFFLDKKYDCVVDLDITNPFRTVQDIEKCVEIFKKKRPKTVFSVTKSRKNPYFNQTIGHKGSFTTPIGHVLGFSAAEIPLRRQTAPEVYDLNACIYIYNTEWLLDDKNLSPITDISEIYVMPDWAFCDIDNEVDLEVSKALWKKYMETPEG